MGYAHDEFYPNDTMTVDEISTALKNGGVKFDWIGFDACLMANMETAIAVEPYADYLIASEETEPGTGWYYTNWLSQLAGNTSLPTTSIGKAIIDDFIQASYQSSSRDKTTLSLIDLAEFSGTIPGIFSEFSKEITATIKSDEFTQVADEDRPDRPDSLLQEHRNGFFQFSGRNRAVLCQIQSLQQHDQCIRPVHLLPVLQLQPGKQCDEGV